ncbi:LysR family transcriptional regulator [Brevibacillus centrosporus]|uniref:LysR family transcriptional regulator n=1 Tax=Brevibacillus centrosporus TaxID=54910 RepID=UPI001143E8CE|nr:LysR family transcriptional regulator [Brevibacillus centrosporus]MEC2133344.1 LysR family transcriptional regulator [Brevibacillus centrosporus]GED34515.1 LysR family transcriptional regulator [Brevibacillus centrosporus]
MDIEQLQAFLHVANSKSFTRAAEKMNVVQSTITTRIQMLERHIGKDLFKRDKRNIGLTSAGRSFLPYAERIVDLSREGMKVTQLEQTFHDQLVIGTTHALWDYVIFAAIDDFQKSNSQISVRMITEHSSFIIRKMIDGLIDLGIVFYPAYHSNIESIPIIEDTYELVATPTFHLPDFPLTSKDLRTLPYIHLNWGGSFSDWIQQVFGNHYIFQLEVDHVSLLLKFLESNQGVGFLPHSIAKRLIETGEIISIPFMSDTPLPKRIIYMVNRKRNNNIDHLEQLISCIQRSF